MPVGTRTAELTSRGRVLARMPPPRAFRNRPSRKTLTAGSTLGLATALAVAIPLNPTWVVGGLARLSPDVTYYVETERAAVALTIDDGPDPVATPLILEVLKRHGARATFFLISDRVPGNEALVKRILDEGHEVANHLTHEEPSILLPSRRFEEELRSAHETLSEYQESRWFRPGSGWYDDEMLSTVGRFGYSTVLGSVYPYDAQIPSAWFAERYILSNVRPGAIIVLHDVGARGLRTAAALDGILPGLAARGLEVTTLTDLAGAGASGL